MPLPPALLAKLQKRGIVKQKLQETVSGPEEEVIAEDYDDHNATEEDVLDDKHTPVLQMESAIKVNDPKKPATNCPNKYSVYHICSQYCFENWLPRQPSPGTERKRKLMLIKYPLPDDWQECLDPGVGRHYYWNTKTDEVSWLPPEHPRSKISLPAVKLRAMVKAAEKEEEDEDDSSDEEEEAPVESNEKKTRTPQRRGYNPNDRVSRGGSRREPELDPMDPASYGECGRGTWSTGLSRKGEAKTGADTTASGPLYQMRPYPSPGAILRMNAENSKPPPTK